MDSRRYLSAIPPLPTFPLPLPDPVPTPPPEDNGEAGGRRGRKPPAPQVRALLREGDAPPAAAAAGPEGDVSLVQFLRVYARLDGDNVGVDMV